MVALVASGRHPHRDQYRDQRNLHPLRHTSLFRHQRLLRRQLLQSRALLILTHSGTTATQRMRRPWLTTNYPYTRRPEDLATVQTPGPIALRTTTRKHTAATAAGHLSLLSILPDFMIQDRREMALWQPHLLTDRRNLHQADIAAAHKVIPSQSRPANHLL